MNLSRKWLKDFTRIDASPEEYADAMTMSGSKVELTRDPGAEIKNVVVGRVISTERHPDSDHLWVCLVDVGREKPVQIVTGAQNVRAGDFVPAALHKSTLPGGKKIEKGKLRGVKSEGMLCSLDELALDLHDFPDAAEDGIFILTDMADLIPGCDIRPVIGADDSIVEFEITNNRPDCLSVIGLARESAATFGTEFNVPQPRVKAGGGDINELLKIEISDPELCPRYTGRMVKNIKIAPSPKWMRQRLRASGVRPINNIVDITNYVMLEYGQPMHAFDYACLDGGKIIVRTAREGETMKTLDGTPRELTPDMLVIADSGKAVGVAGVMGGENSEITEATRYAVFESANFDGVSIRRTASALGMRTDASGRYEKGLDTENTLPAVQRACELVELLGAGEVLDGIIDIRAREYAPRTVSLESERINALLGTSIPRADMLTILEKIGFASIGDVITVPSWRGDVEHWTDLAEEVARFYGYDKIEPTLFTGDIAPGGLTETQAVLRQAGSVLRGIGYNEICTYSFIGQSDYDKIALPKDASERRGITILNPLGEDRSVMRATPLPCMLDALRRNKASRADAALLYEPAKVYIPSADGSPLPDERIILTLGAYGNTDFYDIKGAALALLDALRISDTDVELRPRSDLPSYHPGRCADIYIGDEKIGVLGQVHPAVADNYDLPETYAAELDFNLIFAHRGAEPTFAPLPRYPAVERDIAVVCAVDVTVAELTALIKRGGGAYLREADLFDIYTGAPIPEGKKSAAFSLRFRSDEATLTDEDADGAVRSILALLESELGAVIR
ncbi:MAG: phenylalanine--tRNA ligase subunit beta [Oscillospiraceae bacterium]|jgi:phenylalanyl-tRNA synthetase beta chain|nr:phenylalanine--tRNA ligase subunit beta [Oscillospiraceae bacterium]